MPFALRRAFSWSAGLIGLALVGMMPARADEGEFIQSLPAWAQNAAGLASLSPAQQDALNAAVNHDIKLAEQGDTVAFSSTFSARRTPSEKKALGLDLLSFDQINRLDQDVEHAIAYRPRLASAPAGPSPLVNAGAVATFKRPWQTHGDVSFTVGGGKHSSFYGGSVDVVETDPTGHFTLAVGISQFHGKGFFPCDRYDYGRPYWLPDSW